MWRSGLSGTTSRCRSRQVSHVWHYHSMETAVDRALLEPAPALLGPVLRFPIASRLDERTVAPVGDRVDVDRKRAQGDDPRRLLDRVGEQVGVGSPHQERSGRKVDLDLVSASLAVEGG